MNKLQILEREKGVFVIEGDLTFASIDKDTLKSLDFLTASKTITLDLSQVVVTDSAGLALIIEWLKYARNKRIQIRVKNIPEQLRKIAKLSGLDKIGTLVINADSDSNPTTA